MSLEQALQENTAALKVVAELLKVSNADRKALMASAGTTGASAPNASADDDMSVADIKEKVKAADLPTLKRMLTDETAGKNRSTAVKAIEEAIAAAERGQGNAYDRPPLQWVCCTLTALQPARRAQRQHSS
jgi:hypothetical protein